MPNDSEISNQSPMVITEPQPSASNGIGSRPKSSVQDAFTLLKAGQSSLLKRSSSETKNLDTSREGSSNFKLPRLDNFLMKTIDNDKKDIDRQLTKFIYATNSTFSMVEHKELRKLVQLLRPVYRLSTRHNIGGPFLDEIYENELEN